MKTVLPLLSRPNYQRLKSGKARGGEAVIMAENVRMYYDILSRYEAPYQPGNGQLAQPAETTPANDPGPVIARLAAKRPGAVNATMNRRRPSQGRNAAGTDCAAIRVLVVFQNRHQRSTDRQPGTVQVCRISVCFPLR